VVQATGWMMEVVRSRWHGSDTEAAKLGNMMTLPRQMIVKLVRGGRQYAR
jgi:hypothetical protein